MFFDGFPPKLIISLEPIYLIVNKKLLQYLQNSRRWRVDNIFVDTQTSTDAEATKIHGNVVSCHVIITVGAHARQL